jgi:hypothetical protein
VPLSNLFCIVVNTAQTFNLKEKQNQEQQQPRRLVLVVVVAAKGGSSSDGPCRSGGGVFGDWLSETRRGLMGLLVLFFWCLILGSYFLCHLVLNSWFLVCWFGGGKAHHLPLFFHIIRIYLRTQTSPTPLHHNHPFFSSFFFLVSKGRGCCFAL